MSPFLLDMTKDECRRVLRRLELDAYSSVVSAFRAQGHLTKDKKKALQDMCIYLGISTERYRAEIRRAANDEKLATISEQIAGGTLLSEWLLEGQRLIPLMPRLVPQTAFTSIANRAANAAATQNASLKVHLKATCQRGSQSTRDGETEVGEKSSLHESERLLSKPADESAVESNIYMQSAGLSSSFMEVLSPSSAADVASRDVQCPSSALEPSALTGQYSDTLLTTEGPEHVKENVKTEDGGKNYSCQLLTCKEVLVSEKNDALSPSNSVANSPLTKVIIFPTSNPSLSTNILQRPPRSAAAVNPAEGASGTPTSLCLQSKSTSAKLQLPDGRRKVGAADANSEANASLPQDTKSTLASFVVPTHLDSSTQSTLSGSGLKLITQACLPLSGTSKLIQKQPYGNTSPIVVVTKSASQGGTSSARVVNVFTTKTSSGKVLSPASLARSQGCTTAPALMMGPKGKQAAIVKVAPGVSLATAGGKPNVIVVQKGHMLAANQACSGTIHASLKGASQTMLKTSKEAVILRNDKLQQFGQFDNKSTVLADILQAAGILPEFSAEGRHGSKATVQPGGVIRMEKLSATDEVDKDGLTEEGTLDAGNVDPKRIDEHEGVKTISRSKDVATAFVTTATSSDDYRASSLDGGQGRLLQWQLKTEQFTDLDDTLIEILKTAATGVDKRVEVKPNLKSTASESGNLVTPGNPEAANTGNVGKANACKVDSDANLDREEVGADKSGRTTDAVPSEELGCVRMQRARMYIASCHDNGELDPQTGIFYPFNKLDTSKSYSVVLATDKGSKAPAVNVDRQRATECTDSQAIKYVNIDGQNLIRVNICESVSEPNSNKLDDEGSIVAATDRDGRDTGVLQEESQGVGFVFPKDITLIKEGGNCFLKVNVPKKFDGPNSVEPDQKLLRTEVTYGKSSVDSKSDNVLELNVADGALSDLQTADCGEYYSERVVDNNVGVVCSDVLEVLECEIPFVDGSFTSGIEETVVTSEGNDRLVVDTLNCDSEMNSLVMESGYSKGLTSMQIPFDNVMLRPESHLSGSSLFMVTDSSAGNKSLELPVLQLTTDLHSPIQLIAGENSKMDATDLTAAADGGSESQLKTEDERYADEGPSTSSPRLGSNEETEEVISRKRKRITPGGSSMELEDRFWVSAVQRLLDRVMDLWHSKNDEFREVAGHLCITECCKHFEKIQTKLETNCYHDLAAFHKDLLGIEATLGSDIPYTDAKARQVCEQVFEYCHQEYDRICVSFDCCQRKKCKS